MQTLQRFQVTTSADGVQQQQLLIVAAAGACLLPTAAAQHVCPARRRCIRPITQQGGVAEVAASASPRSSSRSAFGHGPACQAGTKRDRVPALLSSNMQLTAACVPLQVDRYRNGHMDLGRWGTPAHGWLTSQSGHVCVRGAKSGSSWQLDGFNTQPRSRL